ncbi:hypothetical protein HDV05_006802 [Chytridiales sp. JEL 0842]|nr:hypothetical protein HDV05_006802 [Chytridiales sp. JEL 0842]
MSTREDCLTVTSTFSTIWNFAFDNCCGLPEIRCAGGRVTEIYLSGRLQGGPLPTAVGSLTGLQVLELGENGFTGGIPSSWASLSNLRVIRLYGNRLNDPLPSWLGNSWTSMVTLQINTNPITGSIPDSMRNMQQLTQVFMSDTYLDGNLPDFFGALPNLVYLNLGHGKLRGPIPASLGSSPSLQYIFIDNNSLLGEIPASMGSSGSLKTFYAFNNQLTGALPAALSRIADLRVDDNCISGLANQRTGCPVLPSPDNPQPNPSDPSQPAPPSSTVSSGILLPSSVPRPNPPAGTGGTSPGSNPQTPGSGVTQPGENSTPSGSSVAAGQSGDAGGGGLSVGVYVGIGVGCVVVLAILGIFWSRRRRGGRKAVGQMKKLDGGVEVVDKDGEGGFALRDVHESMGVSGPAAASSRLTGGSGTEKVEETLVDVDPPAFEDAADEAMIPLEKLSVPNTTPTDVFPLDLTKQPHPHETLTPPSPLSASSQILVSSGLPPKMSDWNSLQVCNWLQHLQFPTDTVLKFADHRVTGKVLELTPIDKLKEQLGLDAVDAKRLGREVEGYLAMGGVGLGGSGEEGGLPGYYQ